MVYAVTLPLDAAAAKRIRRMWHMLAGQAGADDAIRLGYAPHLTLAVLPDTAPVTGIEEAAFRVAENWAPFPLILAGLGVFPGTPPVIWVAPAVTDGLLASHAALLESLAPFAVHPHYRPGNWVPHVTLSQNGPSSAARAIEVLTSAWDGPICTHLERIEWCGFCLWKSCEAKPSDPRQELKTSEQHSEQSGSAARGRL